MLEGFGFVVVYFELQFFVVLLKAQHLHVLQNLIVLADEVLLLEAQTVDLGLHLVEGVVVLVGGLEELLEVLEAGVEVLVDGLVGFGAWEFADCFLEVV